MVFDGLTADAQAFLEALKQGTDSVEKAKFTENGKLILDYMQQNYGKVGNLFKAKDIGDGIGINSRGASGALRKLVTDGYAEKIGSNPVVYSLTLLGMETSTEM